ncbi:unnamed protein product, partial [Ectocarpus sp. 8 AP-2014]
ARYVSPTTARAPPNIHDLVQSSPFHALYPAPVNGQTTSWSIPYAFSEPPTARRRRRKQNKYKKTKIQNRTPSGDKAGSEGESVLPASTADGAALQRSYPRDRRSCHRVDVAPCCTPHDEGRAPGYHRLRHVENR